MDKVLNARKGFSLVELAISVTVIGLLLGAVVKGREVLDSSRLSTIASKVAFYDSAVSNFYSLYDQLPGDMVGPNAIIPLCSSVNCTYAGNNNGQINGVGDFATVDNAAEGRGFWEHLAASDLVVETIVPAPAANAVGRTHPRSPFGGQFTVVREVDNINLPGHYFKVSRNQGATVANTALVKPSLARSLDVKIDDGIPFQGRVSGLGGNSCAVAGNPGSYTVATATNDCDLGIKFN